MPANDFYFFLICFKIKTQQKKMMAKARTSSSKAFENRIIREYDNNQTLYSPEKVVEITLNYFQKRYENDIKNGIERKTCHLSSAQPVLSRIKAEFAKRGVAKEYLDQLRLNKVDMHKLNQRKAEKLHNEGVNFKVIRADSMILDCRNMLCDPDATRGMKTIALACLTGRRFVELILNATFDPPKESHPTHEQYWSVVSNLAKQRSQVIPVEVPLLEKRDEIVKCLKEIRTLYERPPSHIKNLSEQKKWVSKMYSQEIARTMHKYCSIVGKISLFRRFYILVINHYFQDQSKSNARLASDSLGHRRISATLLNYMNF
jgi:hypothetical protein